MRPWLPSRRLPEPPPRLPRRAPRLPRPAGVGRRARFPHSGFRSGWLPASDKRPCQWLTLLILRGTIGCPPGRPWSAPPPVHRAAGRPRPNNTRPHRQSAWPQPRRSARCLSSRGRRPTPQPSAAALRISRCWSGHQSAERKGDAVPTLQQHDGACFGRRLHDSPIGAVGQIGPLAEMANVMTLEFKQLRWAFLPSRHRSCCRG